MTEIFRGFPDDALASNKLNGDPDTAEINAAENTLQFDSVSGTSIPPLFGREPKGFLEHWRDTNPKQADTEPGSIDS